ncbi:DUF4124 domain-containing protein [Lysobacter sp. A6]|uniref:DUF4124 domain-containing protein n=1 Tax=Noviluteimonas lactosilytica TaxID=2888523 RepID=A0ABS8JKB4_9GAMM|nr:DUF4124 domain-containing protein [Lysobacter lactosilyticus]MCC8364046.1 DUF4124 domain-containing protein [Lysobacter lactosilyticus]
MAGRRIHVALLLLFATCALPRFAFAQVHVCTTPDGRPLYTDQKCEALGAVPRQQPAAPSTGARIASAGDRKSSGGCQRTLQDLAFELRSAIDSADANRLSGIYHWVGVSDEGAVAVMDRLDQIAHRPLLDITPVQPSDQQPEATAGSAITGDAGVARTTVRRPPVGLRLEQTRPNSISPLSTTLGLHRHFGCWWVSL